MCLEKDISYLYHVQSEYRSFMGDLEWNDAFSRPYWNSLRQLSDSENSFLKIGCMVFLLLLAIDKIEGSGSSIDAVFEKCVNAAEGVIPHTVVEDRLQILLIALLQKAKLGITLSRDDESELAWLYNEIVVKYFHNRFE